MSLGEEVCEEWLADINVWHTEDPVPQAERKARNPYVSIYKKDALIEKSARKQLQAAELEEIKELNGGVIPKGRKSSQTVFVRLGFRLIGIQNRILNIVKVRETYMAGVRIFVDVDEHAATARGTPTVTEAVRLWMPSEIPESARATIGNAQLYEVEATLRRSQFYMRGQQKSSRSQTLIDSVSDSVNAEARRYRQARLVLLQLVSEEGCGEFRNLEKEDVRLRYVQDHDAKAARRLAKLAGRPTPGMLQGFNIGSDSEDDSDGDPTLVEGTAQEAPSEDDEYLHDSVRMEWCKSYARKERWREEVIIGEDKMPRMLQSLKYEVQQWRTRVDVKFGSLREINGRRAYAYRQAAVYDALHAAFVRSDNDVPGQIISMVIIHSDYHVNTCIFIVYCPISTYVCICDSGVQKSKALVGEAALFCIGKGTQPTVMERRRPRGTANPKG
ncbi:hypothetical protein BDZ89DRAFT_1049014 [Hymenopellis radicata]|nr:hypothetical protein BDZ89DRAFT_1049014 [Hymenopellis radicata]